VGNAMMFTRVHEDRSLDGRGHRAARLIVSTFGHDQTDSSIPSPARTGRKSHHYEPRATLRHGASERAHSTSYARGMRQSGIVTVLQPHLGPNARLG